MSRQVQIGIILFLALVGLPACLGVGTVPPATQTPTVVADTPTETATPIPEPTATPTPLTSTPTPATTTVTSPTTSPEPAYDDQTGPTSLLASYYNAINRRDYARAWSYWESPPSSSYEAFVQGFADTGHVLLAVHPPTWFEGAAGSTYARVAVLMSATHNDGSRHNFLGCFVARRPNIGGPMGDHDWSLYEATVDPAPGNATDATLLSGACDPEPETDYDYQASPVRLLASYYNAINRGEYARAWSYWETPPDPSFEEFEAGFNDTESILLVVRPPIRFEGAADSAYTDIPVLLSATHTDGSRHNFVGCFVARRPNVEGPEVERVWSLFNAAIESAPGNTADVTLLNRACVGE